MVRGFNFQDPRWGLNLQGSTIDPSWAKAPQVSFAEPVAGLAKGFMEGLNAGDAFVSRRNVGGQIQDMAKEGNPAERLMGAGASYTQQGGAGNDTVAAPMSRSVPTFAQGGAGATAKTMPSGTHWNAENRQAIIDEATAAGYNPEDLATVMSYETAGSMDPWKAGPTTKWGQHRGLIQWGEPQAQQYGVNANMPFRDQVRASIKYLQDRGLKPGMGMLEMYSAINAGGISPSHFNRSDTAAGGAPGTVRDKVTGQMGAHRKRVQAWFGQNQGMPAPGQPVEPAPGPQAVAQAQQAAQPSVSAQPSQGAPATVQQQAQQVLAAPDQFDPRTVQWAAGVVGQQQGNQPAAVPQLAPSPNDREAAAAVTRNQVETQKEAQAPKPPTFMGIPAMAPGGNVNPQAPQMAGGSGQDILMGGSGGGPQGQPQTPAAGGPQQPPAAPPPQQMAQAPAMPQAQPLPVQRPAYRAPIRQAGGATDPRLLRAYGTAIAGGDANTISAMQTLLQQSAKAGNGKVSLHNLPDGSTVLLDETTGEVSPYAGGNGSTKAPEVREVNGVSHQWDGRQWVPLAGAVPAGDQYEMVGPGDIDRRRSLNIDPTDKRAYQRDRKTGKLDPINEQRAVDDKSFQQERDLANDFEQREVVREARKAEQGLQGTRAAFAEGNAHSDFVGIIQLFKTIDPGSTVTGNEAASVTNAAGVPGWMHGLYNKLFNEGGSLRPEDRAKLFNALQAQSLGKINQIESLAEGFKARAKKAGVDPDLVVNYKPLKFERATPEMFKDAAPDVPPAPPPPGAGQPAPAPAPAPLQLRVAPGRGDRGAADAFDMNTNPPPDIRVRKLSD